MKNDSNIQDLITQLQEQLVALNKKVDILIQRASTETKPALKAVVNNTPVQPKNNDRQHGREQYKAICADCHQECTIPFKPSGDRPVYCKDCFSRRKMINMSGIKINEKPQVVAPVAAVITPTSVETEKPQAKKKKKAVVPKKPVAKKKPAPKKK